VWSKVKSLNLTLKVWRQDGPNAAGHFDTIAANGIKDEMSFLEMLDVVNENLTMDGKEPVVFDHDCREGICGTCSLMINGQAQRSARPRASSTCASSTTAKRSRSSRGALPRSRS
jgi:succinate dehydrogenase / fumarate reductase, iron-sulfur subunit